jgi:hypothetical protein
MDMQERRMSRLDEKVALVVGAGSIAPGWSNGKACAVAFARAGAAVACVDFHLERAEETAHLIISEGGRAIALRADAASEPDMQEVVKRTVAELGGLHLLHNNVGIGGSVGTPDRIEPAAWDAEIRQNLTTAYMGARCAVPHMRAHGGGAIINVSSTLATRFLGLPNVGYSAAKAAVEAMTRACALAYGRDNIRVNCLRLGFIETPLMHMSLEVRKFSDERKQAELDKSRGKVPLRGEHTDPFDAAAAAVFLASDEARHITGAILNVDGGLDCAPL